MEIQKRYNQILDRSFKYDLKLFLFDTFLKGEIENKGPNNYQSFFPNELLIKKYSLTRQLPKESDRIPDTQIEVGQFDKALKKWLTENKNFTNEYKNIFQRKRFISLNEFKEFYQEKKNPSCFYCGITEDVIEKLITEQKINTKRLLIRGRTLEVDKKDPKGKYEKDNMVLCCYWCNNAKTDEFTHEEFINVGNEIREIWKKRF